MLLFQMTIDKSLHILQSALDRCRVEDVRTPGIYEALTFLEGSCKEQEPFTQFRAALQLQRTTHQDKEARWQALNAALNAIRRWVSGESNS